MNKNLFIIIPGILTGIIFILPLLLFGILNVGNGAGLLLAATLIFYGLFWKKTNLFIKKGLKTISGKFLISLALLIVFISVVLISGYTVRMIRAANNPPVGKTTVVVLGCKVKPTGPSLMLTTRLEATLSYLKDNPSLMCVLSGGQGTDEHISEARAMKDWLTERGIDEKRLYIEDKSTSTRENLSFSLDIIKKEGLPEKITIITNEFHQYRAQKIAENLATSCYAVSAKTPIYLLPTYHLRELGAILAEILI